MQQASDPRTIEVEIERLQNAVAHLQRSNAELGEELQRAPDETYSDAIVVCAHLH